MQHKEIQEQQHTLPNYTSQQIRNSIRQLDINICNLWIMEVTLNRWFSFCLILKFVALHFLPLVIVRNYYFYYYYYLVPFSTILHHSTLFNTICPSHCKIMDFQTFWLLTHLLTDWHVRSLEGPSPLKSLNKYPLIFLGF